MRRRAAAVSTWCPSLSLSLSLSRQRHQATRPRTRLCLTQEGVDCYLLLLHLSAPVDRAYGEPGNRHRAWPRLPHATRGALLDDPRSPLVPKRRQRGGMGDLRIAVSATRAVRPR